ELRRRHCYKVGPEVLAEFWRGTGKALRCILPYLFINNSFQLATKVSGNVPLSPNPLAKKRWPSPLTSYGDNTAARDSLQSGRASLTENSLPLTSIPIAVNPSPGAT